MADNGNKRKVMIAMDGSEYSEGALKWFVKNLYRKNDDDVIVLHVTDHRDSMSYSSPWMPVDPALITLAFQKEEEKAKITIKKLDAIIMDAGLQANVVRAHGNPGEQIVKKSEELGITMIIIASRGLGTIRRTIMGSVSDYVVHHSSIPVIVFRN
ncbi:universal stress protein YxiE-like [Saccostrea echinata]|uniref:universal stress protein YxiE-like n=1 Tax=Saccostrea echinata TaxID=191078 RepID=UPI002A7EE304|nr:universal stress protein YxiE-like [Saccostrea echinata]